MRKEGKDLKKELPLLHGIPFSVKDNIAEKGKISSIASTAYADRVMSEDAVVIKQFKLAGGIPLVRGSLP